MPQPSQFAHRNVTSTALPYRSNMSPTDTSPSFVSGSSDILTSVAGYAERRPGFSLNMETTPTVFNNLQRLFTWDRFDGTFVEMACDINNSNQAVVYKRVVGIDTSFVSIYTDTGSSTPFDFVVSNNQVYFSNGHVAQKYDPVNGVSNWGIAIGSVNNSTGPNPPATVANHGYANSRAWTSPGNVTAEDGVYATNSITNDTVTSDGLDITNFGFSIPSTTSILGIQVDVKCFATSTGVPQPLTVYLLKAGAVTGSFRQSSFPISNSFVSLGGSSDLWGTTITPNDVNQTNFGVQIYPNGEFNPGTQNMSIDFVRVTVFGLGGPSISVSASAGSLSATTGFQYVFCYGNSNTGHISSPSPVSNSTGVFSSKLNVQVSLTASTDPQVNQIHVFRSTDSVAPGVTGGTFFEIPNSPFANTSANITDNAADTALNIFSISPFPSFNDPPTAAKQPVYFAGRIWMYINNKVYFSGLEEVINGVPEESFPSGNAGNFWNFDQPVQGLAVAGTGLAQTLMVFCGGRVYGISGSSLDTFRRFLISNRRGCRNQNTITSLGGMVAWLDSSMTVWATDGNSLQELSVDIRPDLSALPTTGASFTFHVSGRFHWLVCAFSGKMYIYDLDTQQWMPPWLVSSSYVTSAEISAGNYSLLLSNGNKAIMLNQTSGAGNFNDNGVTYQPILITTNHAIVPDFGRRFSYNSLGLYDEPSRTGAGWFVQADTNSSTTFSDVGVLIDDDPLNSGSIYSSIYNNQVTPQVAWNRGQGIYLVQNIYAVPQSGSVGRWYSIKFKLAKADTVDRMYGWFLAYTERR